MAKRMVLLAAALAACVSFAQDSGAKQSSLAAARAKITKVIESPALMTEVMKGLAAEEQKTFLADVNAAIATMPGNDAERTATFVAVNNAALAGAQKGNALTLVAEVFATVPVYALPAVSESLSSGLMNRAGDKNVTYTDEQYVKISKSVMEKVNERVESEDNSGVRSAFAGIMLIRASNSESPEIKAAVVEAMPESSRNDAKTEWFPAALGTPKSYDAILAAAEVDPSRSETEDEASGDDDAEHIVGLRVSGAQNYECLLADISGAGTDPAFTAAAQNPTVDSSYNRLNYEHPLGVGDAFSETSEIIGRIKRDIESRGYPFQSIRW